MAHHIQCVKINVYFNTVCIIAIYFNTSHSSRLTQPRVGELIAIPKVAEAHSPTLLAIGWVGSYLTRFFLPAINGICLPWLFMGICMCLWAGGLCHHLERRAVPESPEIFGKQAAATRVQLGKEVNHGGFWEFHFAVSDSDTKASGQTKIFVIKSKT